MAQASAVGILAPTQAFSSFGVQLGRKELELFLTQTEPGTNVIPHEPQDDVGVCVAVHGESACLGGSECGESRADKRVQVRWSNPRSLFAAAKGVPRGGAMLPGRTLVERRMFERIAVEEATRLL